MKKLSSRRKLLTTVCRMCYTSTFGLFVFTILNDYSSATNGTATVNQGNITHIEYLNRSTWLSGFNDCKNVYNLTMASVDDINDIEKRGYNVTFDQPVWTYAFEVTIKSTGQTFRIKSNNVSKYAHPYTCSRAGGESATDCCSSFIDGQRICKQKYNMSLALPEIHPQTLSISAQRIYTNTTRWANLTNESEFVHEKSGLLSVRCLLLDENGKLWTDDCNEHHSTLCLSGETQAVFQYVNKTKIPHYTPARPTTPSPGRSSKSPVTSSNNDSNITSVSISTNPQPGKQDFWMDPQIRYSIIGVGCFIVLAILTAVCCCCCRKRRKGENNKRKSAYLADAYSETADSIVMKETSVYETADTSQYAIPEDALKKARHRKSIGENEYDVLQKTKKTQQKFTGNTYNHVTLVSSKDRRGSSNQDENTYDVTNYGKQNSVIISPNDLTGNTYGEVAVKVESEVKTKR